MKQLSKIFPFYVISDNKSKNKAIAKK